MENVIGAIYSEPKPWDNLYPVGYYFAKKDGTLCGPFDRFCQAMQGCRCYIRDLK